MQAYRKRHPSPGNYAQVAIRQVYDDGSVSKWDTSYIYEGFDDVDGFRERQRGKAQVQVPAIEQWPHWRGQQNQRDRAVPDGML